MNFKMHFYFLTGIVLFWSLTLVSSYKIKPAMKKVSSSLECGKSKNTPGVSNRIIDGINSTLGDWPWMVAFGYKISSSEIPMFYCGGSLISKEWVIGAAHCFVNVKIGHLVVVRIGDLNLNDSVSDEASPIDISVKDIQIFTHPNYSNDTVENDIALIRLKKPINFSELIHPICLLTKEEHTKDDFYFDEILHLAGWGHTEYGGPPSEVLQKAQVEIVEREHCSEKYKSLNAKTPIDHRVLCAGHGDSDSCHGDSGGPLMIQIENKYFLAGIVSFGHKCATSYPGVYTNVAAFSDWIKNTTKISF